MYLSNVIIRPAPPSISSRNTIKTITLDIQNINLNTFIIPISNSL